MSAPVSARTRWWILTVVSLTQLLVILDGTIVGVALPRAQVELGMSDSDRQWVVTGYVLAFGSLLLLGGRIVDYWGRKRSFLLGMVGFAAASAWAGFAHSGLELLGARAVQGAFAALMAPAALAILTVTFPSGRERGSAFAIFGAVSGAGSAIGLLLGGVLTEYLDWRWCLLVNIPVAAVGVVLGAVLLTESRAEGDRRYDLPGAITITLGFGAVVYGLTLAETPQNVPLSAVVAGLGVVLLAAFVLIERRSRNPLLPLRILTDRTRAGAFLVQALTGAVMIGAMVYMNFHLQFILKLSPVLAGLATLAITVSIMGTVPFAARLVGRIGPRPQLIFGPVIAAAGVALLLFLTPDGDYWSQVLPAMVLLGVGMGFTFVPLQNLALQGIAPHDAGAAAATANAANQIGGSVGLAVVTNVYVAVAGASARPAAMVAGYHAVFGIGAVLLLLAAAVAFVLIRPSDGRAVGEPRGEGALEELFDDEGVSAADGLVGVPLRP
ncbi:MFS transporter [Leifsonia poae]|uniref:MFS transporter n=1 Tax=Leifsonia poae TaxID=110933 RepID=UPI003D68430E